MMDTRSKIIRVSIKYFLSLGYEKTSLSKIANDVGVKKSSIYYHFKNKEEIFKVSVEYLIDLMENKIKASIENLKTSKEILNAVFNSLIQINNDLLLIIDDESDININNFLHYELRIFPDLINKRNEYYKKLKEIIIYAIAIGQKNKEIRNDINKEFMALEIIAWIEGLFMLNSIYTSFSINAVRQDFFYNLWKVLSAETTNKKSIFGKRTVPKTMSLGTKW